MTSVAVIAASTLREAARRGLPRWLLGFGVAAIFGSALLSQITIGNWDRTILSVGLSTIEWAGTIGAVVLGVSFVGGEIERRTIFSVLAKPVSRPAFLFGRYLGVLAVSLLSVTVMLGALALSLAIVGFETSIAAVSATLLVFVEIAVMAAVAVLFSTLARTGAATTFTFAIFAAGHFSGELRSLGARNPNAAATLAARALRLLPDLELLDVKAQAANRLDVAISFTASSALYGALYAATVLVLAAIVLTLRDLR